MKKSLILLEIIVVIIVLATVVFANDIHDLITNAIKYKIIINGDEKSFEMPIVTINDRTYIPLRETGETLGMDVKWYEKNQTIIMNSQKNETNEEFFLQPFEINKDTPDSLWGYKDEFGNVIIKPQFIDVYEFKEGLARVRTSKGQDGNFGYINIKGEMVIPNIFNGAEDFNNGKARVMFSEHTEDYRYSYIDKSGNILFDKKQFLGASDFNEGYAVVMTKGYGGLVHPDQAKDFRCSYINENGEYATDQEFEGASIFENGLATVRKNGKWGMINKNFELVVDYLYDDANLLRKGD